MTPAGWCGLRAGRDRKTVEAFLDALGEERCKQIELVSCDMAELDLRSDRRAAARTRSAASTRSTSCSSRPTRSTRSAARSGTRPARRPDPSSPASSRAPASRSGRTPRTSPTASTPSSPTIQQTNQRALPRLPAQRATAADLPAPRRRSAIALLDRWLRVGPTLPPAAVRQARPDDHRPARRDPRRDPVTDSPTSAFHTAPPGVFVVVMPSATGPGRS